jgi:hypothetical protein
MDRKEYFSIYVELMHAETNRIIETGESPLLDAE